MTSPQNTEHERGAYLAATLDNETGSHASFPETGTMDAPLKEAYQPRLNRRLMGPPDWPAKKGKAAM